MTRKVLIEEIRRIYYGGLPIDDANLTENEVNLHINQAIAAVAKENYVDYIKMDGVENVDDAFYTTFKNFSVLKDNDTGYYYTTLPHPPLGLSRGYGIADVTFPVSTGLAKNPIPISPRELEYVDMVKTPPSKIYFWCEGKTLWFKSYINLVGKSPIVRMISNESSDLTAEVNVPAEYISRIIDIVLSRLSVRKQMVEDTTNDGIDTK